MNKLKEFNNNQIYNFSPVLNNKKIVVICYIVVLQSIKHDIDMNCIYYIYDRRLFQNQITK